MDILRMILLDSIGQGCFIDIDMYVLTLTLLCQLTKSIALNIEEDLVVGQGGTKNSKRSQLWVTALMQDA